jgi:hypothetical protein
MTELHTVPSHVDNNSRVNKEKKLPKEPEEKESAEFVNEIADNQQTQEEPSDHAESEKMVAKLSQEIKDGDRALEQIHDKLAVGIKDAGDLIKDSRYAIYGPGSENDKKLRGSYSEESSDHWIEVNFEAVPKKLGELKETINHAFAKGYADFDTSQFGTWRDTIVGLET